MFQQKMPESIILMGRVVARTRAGLAGSLDVSAQVHEKISLVASLALTPPVRSKKNSTGSFGLFGFLLIRQFAAVSHGFSPVPCGFVG
jgi:hypothetical protein